MNGTKSKIMFIMCMALGLMSIGYAFFATNLSITSTGNITAGWNVKFVSITEGNNGGTGGSNAATPTFTDTTATISANLRVPGDYMEYEVVLQNAGGIDAIIEKINVEETGSPAIIFSVTGINEGETLASGLSKTMKIRVEYDKDVTSQPSDTVKVLKISVKAVQDAGGMTFPEEDEKEPDSYDGIQYLKNRILADNTSQADTDIDFSQPSSYNVRGLYYTSTNTEGNKTTYYFRGNVRNNFVKFGTYTKNACMYNGKEVIHMDDYGDYGGSGYVPSMTEDECMSYPVCETINGEYVVGWVEESDASDAYGFCTNNLGGEMPGDYATYEPVQADLWWRIVRINEDGSVRLVTQDIVGTSKYNEIYDDNAYVGYMYGTPGSSTHLATHANNNPSTMKTYLDEWYTSNLSSYTSLISTNAGFCNDRSVASSAKLWSSYDTALGYGKNNTYYGAAERLVNINKGTAKENAQPQFKCPNEERDLFTMSTSTKGNKKLTKPIGLLTADEVSYAGGVYYKSNVNMYLSGNNFWTMSPYQFDGANAVGWYMINNGGEYDGSAYAGYMYGVRGVRPVINLAPSVELSTELPSWCSEFDGTLLCPYIIKTN